jgi:hypothetical protein
MARGQAAVDLSVADKLIQDKKYVEANRYLVEFSRKYPDYIEEVQKRLRTIVKIQDQYSKVGAELVSVLKNSPDDAERIRNLTKKLQELDPYNTLDRQNGGFLKQTEVTASFKYYEKRYNEIFAQGSVLIEKGQYAQASRVYEEGFTIYKDEFDAGPVGELVKSQVNSSLGQARSIVADFESIQIDLSVAAAEIERAFALSPEEAKRALDAREGLFIKANSLRNSIAGIGRGFQVQFALLQKADPTLTDSSFLPFAYRFALGRSGTAAPEGILGSMDRQWSAIMERLEAASLSALEREFLAMEKSYDSAAWDECSATALRTSDWATQTVRLFGLWAPRLAKDSGLASIDAARSKAEQIAAFRHLDAVAKAAPPVAASAEAVAAAGFQIKTLSGTPPDPKAAVPALLAIYSATVKEASSLQALKAEAAALRAGVTALESGTSGLSVPGWRDRQDWLEDKISSGLASALSYGVDAVAAAAKVDYDIVMADLAADSDQLAKGQSLVTGIKSDDPDQANFPLCFPDQSMVLAAKTEEGLRTRLSAILALESKYKAFPAAVSASDALAKWMAAAKSGEQSVLSLISSAAELGRLAKAKKQQADSSRLEADKRLEEARTALKQNNFDLAQSKVDKARELYGASLAGQWDPGLSASTTSKTQALAAEIGTGRQNSVVNESRKLLTQGKDQYYAGNFERSEELIVQAQNLWGTVFAEPNAETDIWLGLVRNAVSFRTGRTVPQTAALYPEMSQLLSKAQNAYEQGKSLLAKGRKTEALQRLRDAETLVNQIKIVYPRNQDASVLGLRIKLLTDTGQGSQLFRQLFDQAKAKLKPAAKPTWEEGYNDLLTLKEIDPKWPGMAAAILDAEYLLGIKQRPLDPAIIAQSRSRTEDARRIIDANNVPLFANAKAFLEEALRLNPNNAEASALRDRLFLSSSGPAASGSAQLSLTDESLYQRALLQYRNGQFTAALDGVNALIAKPANKSVAKLAQLKDRILKDMGGR